MAVKELEQSLLFSGHIRASKQLSRYHDYFSDGTRRGPCILPIAIIKKAYFAVMSLRSEAAKTIRRHD